MKATVLIVEDNPQNLYLASYLLESAGYRVISAGDGPAGVAAAIDDSPDIVLVDILLPGIDGYEATRRIKADPSYAGEPIVALTAYSMEGDEQSAMAAGCDGYISKPIDPADFVTRVEGFLECGAGGGETAAAEDRS